MGLLFLSEEMGSAKESQCSGEGGGLFTEYPGYRERGAHCSSHWGFGPGVCPRIQRMALLLYFSPSSWAQALLDLEGSCQLVRACAHLLCLVWGGTLSGP